MAKVDRHFSVKVEHDEYDYGVGDGWLSLNDHHSGGRYEYSSGVFIDPRGIVQVYRGAKGTRLVFAAHGRSWCRSWERYWGDRTIGRLARAFITDIVGEPE